MNPLQARVHGKKVAEWLAEPALNPVEECSVCPFNLYRPVHDSSNGILTCTLTGSHERRHSKEIARKQDCPIPTFGGDESWRDGAEWTRISGGVTLCPSCLCAIGLVGGDHMNPCPYCGQGQLRLAPL